MKQSTGIDRFDGERFSKSRCFLRFGGGGGVPSVTPPPTDNSDEVRAAAVKERQARAMAIGRSRTILGSGFEPLPGQNVKKSALLGGDNSSGY